MDILTLYDNDQNKVVVHEARRVRSGTWYAEWSAMTTDGESFDRHTGEFTCRGAHMDWFTAFVVSHGKQYSNMDKRLQDLVLDALYLAWKRIRRENYESKITARRQRSTAVFLQSGRTDA
jgi:hypothetical protein